MVEESLFSSFCLSRKNATLETTHTKCLFQRSTHLQSQILKDAKHLVIMLVSE